MGLSSCLSLSLSFSLYVSLPRVLSFSLPDPLYPDQHYISLPLVSHSLHTYMYMHVCMHASMHVCMYPQTNKIFIYWTCVACSTSLKPEYRHMYWTFVCCSASLKPEYRHICWTSRCGSCFWKSVAVLVLFCSYLLFATVLLMVFRFLFARWTPPPSSISACHQCLPLSYQCLPLGGSCIWSHDSSVVGGVALSW